MSLQATEAECAANAVAPRVALADIEAKIAAVYHLNAHDAVEATVGAPVPELKLLSVCLLVMRNGFTIIGKSAPASASNFNTDLGRKLAYEDAIRQAWPLEGYALRDRLLAEAPPQARVLVDGFPRRNRIDLQTPAEKAIRGAVQAVEEAGADERLTSAVMLLGEALDKVADYVEAP